jgi:hypothetical protein
MESAVYLGIFLLYCLAASVVTGVLLLLGIGGGSALTAGGCIVGFGLPLLALYGHKRSEERGA